MAGLLLTSCSEVRDAEPGAAGGDRGRISGDISDPASGEDPTPFPPATIGASPTPTACADLVVEQVASVETNRLSEASGVVASQRHPGVLWTHNDSGAAPAVLAVGLDGRDLGSFPLPLDGSRDIEDIALVNGELYLADIGDNDRERDDVAVYRFDEPDPFADAGIETVEVFRFRYPDGAHDAEAFLVDPLTGQLVIIDKSFRFVVGGTSGPLAPSPASVYVASPPFGDHNEFQLAGTVALDQLAPLALAPTPGGTIGQFGVGGLATGADISGDGSVVAVRTYTTVWLFDRAEGQSVAEALATEPCEAPTLLEEQGEAVGFLDPSSRGFVTISEGDHPAINLTRNPDFDG